jgi:hypothetical protein
MAHILNFFRRAAEPGDWSNDELAELYRVENSLLQAGVPVSTERGLSDEGDPWFAFCGSNGDVIVHIARFDGLYHIYAQALAEGLKGRSFIEITKTFVSGLPMRVSKGVTLHPSAMLGLLVATLFFAVDHKSGSARAAEHCPSAAHEGDSASRGVDSASLSTTVRRYARVLAQSGMEKAFPSDGEVDTVARFIVIAATVGSDASVDSTIGATVTGSAAAPFEPRLSDATPSASTFAPLVSPRSGLPDVASATYAEPVAPTPVGAVQAKPVVAALASQGAGPSQDGARDFANFAGGPASPHKAAPVAPTILADVNPEGSIVVQGSGVLSLGENLANGHGTIVIAKDTHVALQLNVLPGKGAAPADVTLQLSGDSFVDLTRLAVSTGPAHESTVVASAAANTDKNTSPLAALVGTNSPTTSSAISEIPTAPDNSSASTLDLSVDSAGAAPNALSLGGDVGAGTDLTIQITGGQSLLLNESASNLSSVSLDSSHFQGALTVGVDLGAVDAGATIIGSSSFVVGENSSFALLNVNNNATVEFGLSVSSAIIDMTPGASSLTFQLLATDPSTNGVSVVAVSAGAVSNLTIQSQGGSQQANSLDVIYSNALSKLAITGDAPLSIGAFVISNSGSATPATVDASQFTGNLKVDVSGLAASLNGQAGLTVKAGLANNIITDLYIDTPVTIGGGGGADKITLGAGTTEASLVDLTPKDQVAIGGGSNVDAVIDGTRLPGLSQASLDALTLVGAAEAVAFAAGAASAHQAVMFNYGGNAYVFVDALGSHMFNSSVDAIVGVVGVAGSPAAAALAGIFHSA